MKLIIAFIVPGQLDAVEAALDKRVACLMSVSPMSGYGPEPGALGSFRGARFRIRRAKLRLEIAVDEEFLEAAVQAIHRAMLASDVELPGDRKIFVTHLDEHQEDNRAYRTGRAPF